MDQTERPFQPARSTPAAQPIARGPTPNVVIADRDTASNAALADMLSASGIGATTVTSARSLLVGNRLDACQLVILDISAFEDGGLSVIRSLTEADRSPGIIVLTQMPAEVDRIVALEMGADDCVPRSTSPREMLARIRAVLRRRGQIGCDGQWTPQAAGSLLPSGAVACFGDWRFDLPRRQLTAPDARRVRLTSGECGMLGTFVTEPQVVHTREVLVRAYGKAWIAPQDRSIDVNISRLRRKLASYADDELIRTVRNEGYLFVPFVTFQDASADSFTIREK